MPVEGPLPQTGDQQDIGADADRCFIARMPRNWKPHGLAGTDDYGLDYQIQTTPGQRATDVFRVQLKGTRSPGSSSDGEFISIQLKASTIRYYDRIVEPVLLVVCDLSADPDPVDCPLYYAWVRDELCRISVATLDPEQKYVNLRVHKSNRLMCSTDLSADIDAQNELSRAGHAMFQSVEQTHPGMQVEDRVTVVQKISSGIAIRSAAFIDALASPAEQHWIEPAHGSLAWHLKAAERLLKVSSLDRASAELDAAEAMLHGSTPLEAGDYWFLRGKFQSADCTDELARESFKRAHESNPLGKYLSARVEMELRIRNAEEGPKPYPDLIELLKGDEPVVLSAKSRVLAAEGRFEEALSVADRIIGPERHAARALAHTMSCKPEDALKDCETGLPLSDLPDNTRQLFLVLRARAKFSIAVPSSLASEGDILPPSGLAGIVPSHVKDAWDAIQDAIDILREAGWSSNIELLADIWCATASMLGKQSVLLPELAGAARLRPHLTSLQGALESIAAQCGDFPTALQANERLPSSDTRDLRRTILFHEAQKHTACFRWFDEHFDRLDRNNALFGPAATVAALSAHKLSEPDLVMKWSAELESHPHLAEHAALLHYYLAIELNKIGNDEALDRLIGRFEELGRPFALAVALLQELNPTDGKQAALCVEIADLILKKVEPSSAMAVHVGLALITVKDWQRLSQWCKDFKTRVDAGPRMQGFEALALDRLGETQEARVLLERMLSGGVLDSLALNTYVSIMVRCGYVQEALDAAEKIMDAATSERQQKDCTRLLFNLIQQSDPGSKRLLALAVQMGRLADQKSEVEEGIYLVMFIMATVNADCTPTDRDRADFHRRAEVFFTTFPGSKILKRGELHEDASGEELIAQLRAIVGITEDREASRCRLENQMQQGLTVVPFSWRPKLVLSSVHDVVHLWEIAKVSSADDKKYHLVMLTDTAWKPPTAAFLRERTPLLDLTALMVLFDLDLIDAAVRFFGKIGIAKATLETLASLVNPFSGSPLQSKCTALQNALKPYLNVIVQPSISELDEDKDKDDEGEDEGGVLGREQKEIASLCRQDNNYRLYSDDLAFRVITAKSDKPDGICTLDVLSGFEEAGLLTRQDAAKKVSVLCGWHVGLVVRFEDLVALLPPSLEKVSNVRQGMEILDGHPEFMTAITALWDFRSPFDKTMGHAAAVIRRLTEESSLSNGALASLLGQWFVKAGLKNDAPPTALGVLTKAVIQTAQPPNRSNATAKKLWEVYMQLVEFHHGTAMDEQKEREAIKSLGAECAKLQMTNPGLGEVVYSSLRGGITEGTSPEADFVSGYSAERLRLITPRPT